MIRTTIIALAATALTGAAALAEDSIEIDISSVDFTDAAAVEAVYAKVVEASEEVCTDLYLSAGSRRVGLANAVALYNACVAATVETSIIASGQPALVEALTVEDMEAFDVASN